MELDKIYAAFNFKQRSALFGILKENENERKASLIAKLSLQLPLAE